MWIDLSNKFVYNRAVFVIGCVYLNNYTVNHLLKHVKRVGELEDSVHVKLHDLLTQFIELRHH